MDCTHLTDVSFVRKQAFIMLSTPIKRIASDCRSLWPMSCTSQPCHTLQIPNQRKNHTLPREARVVICGGGVMGASVAYHLAELGWGPNTVLIDQGK